ncbi:MAG: molecular chaperone DnaJ [Deltaproteobacteria bacterium]|nr:molecular chaperone DnaJ [Deltaproteobacteria bacterium]
MRRDFYEVLEVPRDADAAALKRAYRQQALRYHPDKNPGDAQAEERFKEAAEAYGVLSDPEKRSVYDRYGHDGLNRSGWQGGFSSSQDIFSHFGDIFGDLFGGIFGGAAGGGPGRRSRRGADLRMALEISLRDAVFGTERRVEVPRHETCKDCDGTGAAPGGVRTCVHCSGRGQVVSRQGFLTLAMPCPRCDGRGREIHVRCATCRGEGAIRVVNEVEIRIPGGVEDGDTLRVAGKGEAAAGGGEPGNLFVTLAVTPDPRFRREEWDLHTVLEVPFLDALLGTELPLETLDGERKVRIPESSGPGEVITLKGLGVTRLQQRGRGDLHVHLDVRFPRRLSRSQRKALQELRREFA